MYPRNAASPERVAIGPVVLIADGTVQTSGVSVKVIPFGSTEASGTGTVAYSADGVVLYTPVQAETNYTSFVLVASKSGCIPASVTVVTSAESTSGRVTVGTNNDKTGYSLTQSFPTNFSSMAITAGGAVTAGTVSDKTGYSLTQSFPANFGSLAITVGGAVTAGTVSDKTGYSLTAVTGLGNQTANITGNLSGSVGSVTGRVTANTDQWNGVTVTGMPMPTYTQPTGFLAATFPATVASTTNITAASGVTLAATTHTGAVIPTVSTVTNGVTVTTNSDKTGYSLATAPPTAAAIATAVLTTQMTESYAAVGAAPTLAQSQFAIKQHLENSAISGTTQTVYKIDGTTVAMTFTLDSATAPTSIARAT